MNTYQTFLLCIHTKKRNFYIFLFSFFSRVFIILVIWNPSAKKRKKCYISIETIFFHTKLNSGRPTTYKDGIRFIAQPKEKKKILWNFFISFFSLSNSLCTGSHFYVTLSKHSGKKGLLHFF